MRSYVPRWTHLVALQLLWTNSSLAGPDCRPVFSALFEKARAYGMEIKRTRGLNLLVRNVDPATAELEQRVFLFWKRKIPAPNKTDTIHEDQNAEPFVVAPVKPAFDPIGGIDAAFNAPVRAASRALVKKGWMASEKELSLLTLLILTSPIYAFPTDLIHDWGENAREGVAKKALTSDFRLRNIRRRVEAALDEAKEKKHPLSKEEREALWTDVSAEIEAVTAVYADYYETSAKKRAEIAALPKTDTAARSRALENYYETTLHSPLFSSVLGSAGVRDYRTASPSDKHLLELLVLLRERLYFRYQLLPQILEEGAATGDARSAKELGIMREDPLVRELRPRLARGEVSKEQARWQLMKHFFVELEMKAADRVRAKLGRPPHFTDEDIRSSDAAAWSELDR